MNIRSFFDETSRRRRKDNTKLGPGAVEPGASAAHLKTYEAYGRVPVIHASALIHETAVLIGEVHIGADCYIGPHSVCRADQGSIVIEAGTSLQDGCIVHTQRNGRVVVGEFGQIGHGAMLHGCTLGRNVLIGMGAIVLDDAVIEDDAMVGAGTLVTSHQRVPARMIVKGNPGKVSRAVTDTELAHKREITMQYVAFARSGVGIQRAPAHIVGSREPACEVPAPKRLDGGQRGRTPNASPSR